MKTLDHADVMAIAGVEIAPTEIAYALLDADGSPILIRRSVGAVMLAAEEGGLHIVPVH